MRQHVKKTPIPDKTATQFLTGKNWQPYQYEGNVPETCHQDDVLKFETDLKVSYDPKETFCSEETSIIPCDTAGLRWYGKWSLEEDKKELIFEEDGGSVVVFKILLVTENRLELFT